MVRHSACRRVSGVLDLAVLVVVGLCLPAWATETDMQEIPLAEPFECLICHVSDAGGTALNSFGDDFSANLRVWNGNLAAMDSDGDHCTNGVELGDVDGDGQVDGNVTSLLSNPGVAGDCGGSTVDGHTWGELKALFDRK